MIDTLTKHADNLKTILELEGEEGQFEYLIDIGKKKGSLEPQEKIDKKIYYGEIPFLFLYIILPFSKLWSLLTKKRELINLGSIYTLKNQCLKISYELAKKELNHKPRSIHSTISDTLSWFDSEHDI